MAMKETERDAPGSSAALASPATRCCAITNASQIKGRRFKGKLTVRYDNILQVTQTDINKTARDLQSPLPLAQVLYQYNEVFDNKLGTLPGQIHLEVDQSITPMQEPGRRVPVAVKETLIKEIEDMEKDGVIKKVDEPTDWISPLVIVKKPNGRLRICMDPKQLNRALKRAHYLTVTVDETLPQLSKAKVSVCVMSKVAFGMWSWTKSQAI